MWNLLPTTNFFVSLHRDIEIYVTDFITIWSKHFTNETFQECVKQNNQRLEIADLTLMAKALDMLKNPEALKTVNVKIDHETLLLHLTKSYPYSVKLKINLTQGPKELFFQKVTLGLLRSTQDLITSQRELCDLLLRKDREIKEYKEHDEKILRYLKTPTFNDKLHLSTHNCYSRNFGFTEIDTELLIERTYNVVKEVKQETANETPSSSSNGSLNNVKQDIGNETPSSSTSGSLNNVKPDPEEKCETVIKLEASTNVKEEAITQSQGGSSLRVKEENFTQSQSSQSIGSTASPRKKRKIKDL